MIHIQTLKKSHQNTSVVDLENLHIKKGEIFGLLGPNAAGKTTTIQMLITLIKADTAQVSIDTFDLINDKSEIRKNIGYVAQYFGLYGELTVLENLRFYAGLYQVHDEKLFDTLLHKYHIHHFKDSKAESLSGGYKRRLAIVCALAHDPDILFLDEPTAGIDPVTRKELWDIFYELSTQGKTLFVTTHYMEEASRCHHIAFIDKGRILTQGSPMEVEKALGDYLLYIYEGTFKHALIAMLSQLPEVHLVNQFGSQLRLLLSHDASIESIQTKMQPFIDKKVLLEQGSVNLEDVFISLTKKETL